MGDKEFFDRSTELYLESFNFKIIEGSKDSVVAGQLRQISIPDGIPPFPHFSQ
jgi:hypothetical protein